MAYGPVWHRTVAVRLRRVVLSRGMRRLLIVTGLVVAGWLLGGLAPHAAHADTAPVLSGGEAPRLRGVVRDMAAAVSEHVGKVGAVARPRPPAADEPPVEIPPVGEATSSPEADKTVGAEPSRRPVSAPERAREGRAGTAARSAAPKTKRKADAVRGIRGMPRDGAARPGTEIRRAVIPADPAPSAPLPDYEGGMLSGTAVPVPSGGGALGGHLGRWSWPAPPSHWAPLRAPRSIPVAVRTAVDESFFSPD
ncbi:hypothetical protein Acsp04_55500 [Actinomadura sp. NBRC 104425]|uniref:hypothetical protein n=1 Tax=Actinomadura sp. NBRC 104425 TaxID=3032204 RepID=UPI0024A23357|nr:hypothetical protein [Actinomadura sp. NBRC 104425]GLZ15315.1 hypothetical protein Acsp04_55500 [Actinomadura sp. NBRC 104425]